MRVILVNPRGFCAGVHMAIDVVDQLLDLCPEDEVYVYHEIVHNRHIVNRFIDRVYAPDRILHPLRRVGPKGSGEFEQISWDDALTDIATRLHGVIDEHGPAAILPYSDAGNQSLLSMFAAGGRLWSHLGTTRVTGSVCGAVAGAGAASTNGI